MYTVLYALAVLVLLGSGGWLYTHPDWEPAKGVVTSIAGLIALFVNDEGRKEKSANYLRTRGQTARKALERIDKELSNLEHICNEKPYSSEAHRKAVEETSFELLTRDLTPLANYRAYRKLVRSTLDEIERVKVVSKKDVTRLLPFIQQLQKALDKDQALKTLA